MAIHVDRVFAAVDPTDDLERIAGGNETEVYRTDDARYVIKLKHDLGGSAAEALAHAQEMRAVAEAYVDLLGPRHSVPSYYFVARDDAGAAQVLVVQPFLRHGRTLYDVDYRRLSKAEREELAAELRNLIRLALNQYRDRGSMPDLYGRTSSSKAERKRLNRPWMLPYRLWSFLVKRNLLRAHNLMYTDDPQQRVVLIDYDFVRQGRLYKKVYFAVRWVLFWRDLLLIELMRRGVGRG